MPFVRLFYSGVKGKRDGEHTGGNGEENRNRLSRREVEPQGEACGWGPGEEPGPGLESGGEL